MDEVWGGVGAGTEGEGRDAHAGKGGGGEPNHFTKGGRMG